MELKFEVRDIKPIYQYTNFKTVKNSTKEKKAILTMGNVWEATAIVHHSMKVA